MTNILIVESELFSKYLISPDGLFTLAIGPDMPIKLHKKEGSLQLRQSLPGVVVASAAAFNLVDGETTQCALIAGVGSETTVTLVDLIARRFSRPLPVKNASVVEFGTPGTIFVGTSDGEIGILTIDEQGELNVGKALKVSNYAIVLVAPVALETGALVFYTDDGKLAALNLITEQGSEIERDPNAGNIDGMSCHPTLPIFTTWQSGGDISISTPHGWLGLKLTPRNGLAITSVVVQDYSRLFVATSKEVAEFTLSYPGGNVLEGSEPDSIAWDDPAEDQERQDAYELDVDSTDQTDLNLPRLTDSIVYQAPHQRRIVGIAASVKPDSKEPDLTILLTV